MTDQLLELVNRKNDLYIELKKTPKLSNCYNTKKVNFKTYEGIVNREIANAKTQYYARVFQSYKSDMKKTWQVINDTLSRNKKDKSLPEYIIIDGEKITEHKEISNIFNKYFANIGTKLASSINCRDQTQTFKSYLKSPTEKTFSFSKVCEPEVQQILNQMKKKQSRGVDEISSQLLKVIGKEICKSLTLIINQMIETGIYPENFKIAKITPIHKKGDKNVISNYRPISLLPTLSKVFERVIHKQLYSYFNNENLLAEQQYGFRAKHSTELAAIKLVDFVNHEMDIGNTPVTIFLDLSKAFDTLNFDILLSKLRYYGVSGAALDLMKSYLTGRKQYVIFGETKSNFTNTTTGIPQGSILGPLLFSIYINDLITVSEKFNFLMYADDTTLYFNVENFTENEFENECKSELTKLTNWLQHNKLSLNIEKTKGLHFHKPQRKLTPLRLHINNTIIEKVDSFNYLGIILNENLTWKNHIEMVANKIAKITGILNRLKYVYPWQILLSLYNTLIMSHINYGLLLWGTKVYELEHQQKKAVRTIKNNHPLAHSEPLLKDLGLLNVHDLYHIKVLKFYYKLVHTELPSYFNRYLPVFRNENRHDHGYALRLGVRPLIRAPRVHHVFAEATVLYQTVKLINQINRQEPRLLDIINNKTHSCFGLGYFATQTYLQKYSYTCNIDTEICYSCRLLGRPRIPIQGH